MVRCSYDVDIDDICMIYDIYDIDVVYNVPRGFELFDFLNI